MVFKRFNSPWVTEMYTNATPKISSTSNRRAIFLKITVLQKPWKAPRSVELRAILFVSFVIQNFCRSLSRYCDPYDTPIIICIIHDALKSNTKGRTKTSLGEGRGLQTRGASLVIVSLICFASFCLFVFIFVLYLCPSFVPLSYLLL